MLVLIWGLILVLYILKFLRAQNNNKTISLLLFILAIDAFRTLFESAYFGLYFSRAYKLINDNVIFQPSYLVLPKLLNLAAALLILFLLIRHWIPNFITNLEKNKKQIDASELRFSAAIKFSPNPIVIHAEDGEILSVSDKLLELTGYAREDFKTTKDWLDLLYKHQSKALFDEILQSYKLNKTLDTGEVTVYTKNDQLLYWNINSISLGNLDDGRKVRMFTAIDVTENKKLLNRLFLIEHSINQVTESILWLSESGNVVSHNQFAEKQLGYSKEEFAELNFNSLALNIDMSWHDFWHKLSININQDSISSVTTKHGKNISVALSAHYLELNNEKFICMVIHDISLIRAAEKNASESEQRRKFALDAANIGDWDMDLETNIARRSLIHDQCFGYETPVKDWGYDTFLSHVHPMDRARVEAAYLNAMTKDSIYDVEFRVTWPDNTIHWLWSKGRFYLNDKGNPIRVSGIQVDITHKKLEEAALKLNTSAIEASTVGVVIVDALKTDQPIVYANPAFEHITGYNQTEILGRNCRFLNETVRDEEKLSKLKADIEAGNDTELELINIKKDGSKYWVQLRITPVKDDVGNVTHFVGIQNDITERKKAEEEREKLSENIKYLAYNDSLTGLPNKESLIQYLEGFGNLPGMEKMSHAIFLMDVDNFKNINDTFGHYMGDIFLKEVSVRLKSYLNSGCFICRFGGDEFVFVMSDKENYSDKLFENAKSTAEKLLSTMKTSFKLNGLELFSSISIGVALIKSDLNVINSIKQADLAMYHAKNLGRNNIQIFDESLEKVVLYKAKIEQHLRRALDNNELELHYQPQVNSSNIIFGCEALIRWKCQALGSYVSPAEFIPVAEETSLILPIGDWVLASACQTLNKWHQIKAFKKLTVSVNISAIQFKNKSFISNLESLLSDFTFERTNLKIELTESMLADDVENMILIMNQIKELGLTISLDDFGTGYSSLSYLKAFPIDQLKIDQSFVKDILIDKNDASIAEAVIKLSQALALETIAEGVETEQQKSFLIELGCNQFQGYLYSKALPLVDLERFVTEFNKSEV